MKEKRFKKIYNQVAIYNIEICVDTESGVNYMFKSSGYSGGFTPLLDVNGKPIITRDIEN